MVRKMFSLHVFVALTLVMLTSCEKIDLSNAGTATTAKGNLRVSVSQIAQTPLISKQGVQPVAEVCTRLNFAVYDEYDSRMKQVNQTSGDKDFGQCAFQLEAGDYQLVVLAHSANGNPTMTDPQKIQFKNSTGYTDTFMCYGKVNIGEEPRDLSVTLERIVALCRFEITDDIPLEVKTLQFYYTGGSGAFNAFTSLGSVASKQTVSFPVTEGRKQFDLYTFPHEEQGNLSLKVSALDANGSTLYERDFDVPIQQNHITWLSGAFFTGSGASSPTISGVKVNTDWAGTTYLSF